MANVAQSAVPAVLEAQRHAKATGLIYVSDAQPGIHRKRQGRGFSYVDADGRVVKEPATLERIRGLAIPPAYTSVWICSNERGHLQATGRDARGRKQYRYHPKWRTVRDEGKFTRMVEFASHLPRLRRRLRRDRALPGLPKDKVLAVVVTLLDETLIRVGNEEYARTNHSYGLTTLRNRHVKFLRDGRATFVFRGKGGRVHEIVLDDRRLARLVRHCQKLPGQQLFQYIDDDGARQPIDSGMVNDYLRDAMCEGGDEGFTAKDFRTWGATLRAIAYLAVQKCESAISDRTFQRCVAATAQQVATALGNTPAICRKSYINPLVFGAWREGALGKCAPNAALSPRALERVAIDLLRREARRTSARGKSRAAKRAGRTGSLRARVRTQTFEQRAA